MFKYILSFLVFITTIQSIAQKIEPQNGVHQSNDAIYAFINAKIYVSADEVIEHATLIIQNGTVIKVGKLVKVPKNAIKIDLKGYTIYPSFIDPYSTSGITKRVSTHKSPYPQISTSIQGPYYWNEAIHPETNAYKLIDLKLLKNKKELINQGYAILNTHQNDGILRGTSLLLALGEGSIKSNIIQTKVANQYSFSKGVSKQTYPSSQMGSIALMRQFFYDIEWYQTNDKKTFINESFESVIINKDLPHIFKVGNKLEILRVSKIADEFKIPFIVKGNGDEFERIEEIKATNLDLIIPLNFPKPFDLTDPFISRYITLASLKKWEMAPFNPYILSKNDINFSFTTDGLKSTKDVLTNIRIAVKHGLSKSDALKALTSNPAKMLKIDHIVGSLNTDMIANFIIVKGDIFEDGVIYENWIQGHKNKIKDKNEIDIRGKYEFNISQQLYSVEIKGTPTKLNGKIISYFTSTDSLTKLSKTDTVSNKMTINFSGHQGSFVFTIKDSVYNGAVQLNGSYYPKLKLFEGNALMPNGNWVKWSGTRTEDFKLKKTDLEFIIDTTSVANTTFPNMAFGFDSIPISKTYYIKNATLWTNEKEGVIKNSNLLIVDGKIKTISSKAIKVPKSAIIIDAEGKHVTTGIIDEHSHIAISNGVNESGQAVSAEVSIANVVRSNDINIYRQLAGGVTTSQLLHGSANPIGGQSALIKLKWGFEPEQMLVPKADGFIKFALGENVKQSNWGSYNRVRFPQTRMGVEQVFYDAFTRAKLYQKEWNEFNQLTSKEKNGKISPRKDLELDVILEILESKRFVTCHSYIQSEINMLMKVADSMGFRMNTFTHILEGYKLADKMKVHGVGASTFSDWWAYKFEVNEAIPYNAAILHKAGIVTALNSDDAEMGRRLNQEAAKIVKYGGISEQDAWKMVTLNPAKLLHIDDRMGSLKPGKDADIVIWSDNPLSINAKVEQTFIDGILFYDKSINLDLHERDQLDRKRILKLMLEAKNNGAKTQKAKIKTHKHYHCDTLGE